jgi:serine/threonine protein kinase
MRPIADGILVALGAAHALGMVHRDIKPENLFVDPRSGTARLLDFGLVRSAAATAGDTLTLAGAVVGSAIYMSPEQAAGRAEIDERTDIYAAGVLLYEMLAGRPPFLGSAADVVAAHIARRPPRLSTLAPVPAALDALVHRCLAKRREDRPASCAELRTALAAAALDAPASPPSLTGVSLSPVPASRARSASSVRSSFAPRERTHRPCRHGSPRTAAAWRAPTGASWRCSTRTPATTRLASRTRWRARSATAGSPRASSSTPCR